MSLYNLMNGVNNFTPALLAILGLSEDDIPRFRDISLIDEGTKIELFTRQGGGNRETDYIAEANEKLTKHPNYLRDYDDDFDCTYAYFEFSVPEEYAQACKDIAALQEVESPGKTFLKAILNIKDGEK